MAAHLTRVYQDLRAKYDSLDNQEHFDLLRTLTFFHEFSHAEIWEVLRASDWHEYRDDEDIVREGEIDDRFYIIVSGKVQVQANGKSLGNLSNGDCFGETSYVRGAKRQASIKADGPVTILRVSSTLMEQVSSSCQLPGRSRRACCRTSTTSRARWPKWSTVSVAGLATATRRSPTCAPSCAPDFVCGFGYRGCACPRGG